MEKGRLADSSFIYQPSTSLSSHLPAFTIISQPLQPSVSLHTNHPPILSFLMRQS